MFPASPIRDLCLLTSVWLIVPLCPAAAHSSRTAVALACGFLLSTSLTNAVFPWFRRSVAGMVASPVVKQCPSRPVVEHGNECRIHHLRDMRGRLSSRHESFFNNDPDFVQMHTEYASSSRVARRRRNTACVATGSPARWDPAARLHRSSWRQAALLEFGDARSHETPALGDLAIDDRLRPVRPRPDLVPVPGAPAQGERDPAPVDDRRLEDRRAGVARQLPGQYRGVHPDRHDPGSGPATRRGGLAFRGVLPVAQPGDRAGAIRERASHGRRGRRHPEYRRRNSGIRHPRAATLRSASKRKQSAGDSSECPSGLS